MRVPDLVEFIARLPEYLFSKPKSRLAQALVTIWAATVIAAALAYAVLKAWAGLSGQIILPPG